MAPETILVTPTGRVWVVGWQWVLPRSEIPSGLAPDREGRPLPPEWEGQEWSPTFASDQWQLAAVGYAALTGEMPPPRDIPPIRLLQPETPVSVGAVIDKALSRDPANRHASVASFLRAIDRAIGSRTMIVTGVDPGDDDMPGNSEEARLRWALGDEYEVLASLGAGTFGSVWRVRDLTLGREVALKMLHPHIARDERAVTRFRREARLAAQLAHPAIVPIFDWDSRGDVAWYTMELGEAGSLAELIDRGGPRDLEEFAAQIDLVLDALAAAHANGIIHRDLKPENILIDRYRRWRVTDFGIANVAGVDVAGTTGTPAFAAPEQLLGEEQGPQADCFSLAAIVYFALTGKLPFGSGDSRSILALQLGQRADATPFEPEIAAWLQRAFHPEPDQRFADAAAMQTEWRTAADSALQAEGKQTLWRRWVP
jgi:eukaryotic-like serine/threonine-protein kinase